MQHLLRLFTACLMALCCTACVRHIETVHYDNSTTHTLLIYMAGDNTLSTYVTSNLYSICKGLMDSETPINVVIFKDNRTYKEDLPVLFQLRRREDGSKLDTVYLKKWKEEINAADPEVMAEVMKLTFDRFDSEVKGMEFWSHGLSWIPGGSYTPSAQAPLTRAMEYVGIDNNDYAEIWEIRKAFEETNIHLDYMLFDACHMATAEVAYEFRNLCDYILAAPTEIMGDGFPYRQMICSLSMVQDKSKLLSGLSGAYDDFYNLYAENGTFSLIQTSGMKQLHEACNSLCNATVETRKFWEQDPALYQSKIQYYGREITHSRYYFYDLLDWAKALDPKDEFGYNAVEQALGECVLKHFASEWFKASTSIYIGTSCGLAVSIPEFWGLSGNQKLDAAYQQLEWAH